MKTRFILVAALVAFLAHPLMAGDKAAKKDPGAKLADALTGTVWQWNAVSPHERITFKPDGYIHHEDWIKRGLHMSWKAVDRRTVVLKIEGGRAYDRIAVLVFNKKLTKFTGWDFERGREIKPSKKQPPAPKG